MNESILEKLYIETTQRIALLKASIAKAPPPQRLSTAPSHQPKVQTSTPKDASQFGPQKLPHISVGAITGKIIRPISSK